MTTPSWDDAYARSAPPAWDLGQPQPAFIRLAGQGLPIWNQRALRPPSADLE